MPLATLQNSTDTRPRIVDPLCTRETTFVGEGLDNQALTVNIKGPKDSVFGSFAPFSGGSNDPNGLIRPFAVDCDEDLFVNSLLLAV